MQSNKGLNGFFGSLWNSLKKKLGFLMYDQEIIDSSPVASRIFNFANALISAATAGILKTSSYEPTTQEVAILKPIIVSLNDWVFQLVQTIEAEFKTNSNLQNQLASLNNAVRQLQLVRDYYASAPLTSISKEAQDQLADQIDVMVQTFELTIEDLLQNNNINFAKTESKLAVNPSDTFPTGIKVPENFIGYGVQYNVPTNSAVGSISTNVPTNPNNTQIKVATPVNTTATGTTPPKSESTGKYIMLLSIAAALVIAFYPGKQKSSKNQ